MRTNILVVLLAGLGSVDGFAPISPKALPTQNRREGATTARTAPRPSPLGKTNVARRTEPLFMLLDVPDSFFTVTLTGLGIILSVSKSFVRTRTEEMAWERRLEEAREKRLREDPTLSEIELRRKEAAMEWSAYGKPRMDEEKEEREFAKRSRERVAVADREDDTEEEPRRNVYMEEDEIAQFESEYGIDYDPYYDDPYTEDELPTDVKFRVDKRYGDRLYENGEVFFKDKESGLFYRQGAKPRSISFWAK